MNKNTNSARKYSAIKKIYRENYLEDIDHRLRKEAEDAREDCS